MAGKSRRGRGRHLPRSKRKKGIRVSGARPAAVAPQDEPSPRADKPVPSAKAPTPKVAVAEHLNVNVTAELRRIGILSGVILVVLVVLAVIFS